MKIRFFFIAFTFSVFAFAQTTNASLNKTLKEYRQNLLAGNYESLVDYMYPKVFAMVGGKPNVVKMLKMASQKTKEEGVSIKSISHKHGGKMAKKDDEIQIPIIETTVLEAAKDKKRFSTQLMLIAISEDQGKSWTLINTMNQKKEQILMFFPNLSSDLEIKQFEAPKMSPSK